MSRTKKIAILAIIAMVLTMLPVSLFAADDVDRLAGADRIGTAIAIADAGWPKADTVILAPADQANLVDALAAAPLAGQEDAPILLTFKNALNANVKAKIEALGASKVYVVGAISDDVVAAVNAIDGVTAEKLSGADRWATADAINAKLVSPAGSFVVGYNALPDALSVASFAAENGYAIVLTKADGTVDESKLVGDKTYLIGGTTVVKDYAAADDRFSGADRYATNKAVAEGLEFDWDVVYVANGLSLVDALAVAPLAAQDGAFVLLCSANSVQAIDGITAATNIIAVGGTNAVPNSVVDKVYNPGAALTVESVKATSADTLSVQFNRAPENTSDVTFEVKRNTTPVTVSVTWDSKAANLTASSKLPEGSYKVSVKSGDQGLGEFTVEVKKQEVAKIEITSTKLAVTGTGGAQKGYASYTVLDQYGNDITTTYLANNVSFQSGVGTIANKDGLLTITPSAAVNLIQFAEVVITGYDSTTGTSVSKTLTTSTALGTLSSFELGEMTNANDAAFAMDNDTETWYISYTAKDMSGNETKNFDLVKGGLLLTGAGNDELTTSSSYVTAKVVQDPNDITKAAIAVTITNAALSMDLPVAITAMSFAGTTSTLNVTLKKAAAPDTFTLMAPAFDIAINETKAIPFVAYDQNGKQLTKFSELDGKGIVFSPAGEVKLNKNVDGTASLMVGPFTNDGPQIITAMTPSGKLSSLTLNIQKAVKADTLALDSSKLINAMQIGATQKVDFGYDVGGLSAKDQYGRTMDMTGKPGNYQVVASSSDPAVLTVAGTAAGASAITITAVAKGQATVTFKLEDSTAPGVTISSKTMTLNVLADSDIKGYTINEVPNAIYAVNDDISNPGVGGTISNRENAYSARPYVYGTTSSGGKVVLDPAKSAVVGAYVSNGTDFAVDQSQGALGGYKSIYVAAKKLTYPKTEATTTLTVTIKEADSDIHTLSTTIKSSSAAPVAQSINLYVDTTVAGISVNSAGDVVTVDLTAVPAVAAEFAAGKVLTRFDTTGGSANRAKVYFYATDNYGTKAAQFSAIYSNVTGTGTGVIDSAGAITTAPAIGDIVTLTAVTSSGLSKTIQIKFI